MMSIGKPGNVGYYETGEIQGGYISYHAETQKYTEMYGCVVDKTYENTSLEDMLEKLTWYKMLARVEIYGKLPNGKLEWLYTGLEYDNI
jgi:hypothetical protein